MVFTRSLSAGLHEVRICTTNILPWNAGRLKSSAEQRARLLLMHYLGLKSESNTERKYSIACLAAVARRRKWVRMRSRVHGWLNSKQSSAKRASINTYGLLYFFSPFVAPAFFVSRVDLYPKLLPASIRLFCSFGVISTKVLNWII